MTEFSLKIELGNEAMLTAEDVARALRGVARRIDSDGLHGHRAVMDDNGNRVGSFFVSGYPYSELGYYEEAEEHGVKPVFEMPPTRPSELGYYEEER